MYSDEGFLKKVNSNEPPTRKLFLERTWSRNQLLLNVSHNTVDGTFKFPCTTIGGPMMGSPCSFPFVYPDCKGSHLAADIRNKSKLDCSFVAVSEILFMWKQSDCYT